jgi:hypothetical protein
MRKHTLRRDQQRCIDVLSRLELKVCSECGAVVQFKLCLQCDEVFEAGHNVGCDYGHAHVFHWIAESDEGVSSE